jgi:predicted dehydrogenase
MIRVGLIGFGYWGPNLARNIAETPGLMLTAVADARPERLEIVARRYPDATRVSDPAALIDRADVDAVVIATPLSLHVPLARAAIERGKHALVEKPLAPTAAEAESLGDLAERRGVCLMVDHTFVYNGAVRKMKAIVDAGELGTLLYLDSVRVNLGLFQHDSNVVWDLASHDLAIVDYLLDEQPAAVSANGGMPAGYHRESIAYITLHFASGFIAHLHVNWLAPVKIRRMLIGGAQKMLTYDDMEPSEKVRVYDKGIEFDAGDDERRRQLLVSYRTGDMYAPKLDRHEALQLLVREFADAISARRPPLTNAAAGARVVRLLEAAEQSLRSEGKRVKV